MQMVDSHVLVPNLSIDNRDFDAIPIEIRVRCESCFSVTDHSSQSNVHEGPSKGNIFGPGYGRKDTTYYGVEVARLKARYHVSPFSLLIVYRHPLLSKLAF